MGINDFHKHKRLSLNKSSVSVLTQSYQL